MSLADYLAKNYLTADSKPEKKSKKRKSKDGAQPGLIIADDDASGWVTKSLDGDDNDGPLHVGSTTAEFRKTKKNNWQTIGAPAPSSADQVAADAIIASAVAESSAHNATDEDDAPVVDVTARTMESGAHAGLQSADQVTAQLKRKQEEEHERFLAQGAGNSGQGKETIYRDASGRIINIAMKRAEARKKAEEEALAVAQALEAQKGDVQHWDRERRKAEIKEAKFMTVARYADDTDMNEELKEKERWNDPAMKFLTKKKGGKSVSGKPLYGGSFMPNRYGIRPGHRWDGVDRGNGFEKEWFGARNRRKDLRELEYAWQMDE
ncbi:MAG: hypothetical protein Q9212_000554 [Teloschistes hypoglaucus]